MKLTLGNKILSVLTPLLLFWQYRYATTSACPANTIGENARARVAAKDNAPAAVRTFFLTIFSLSLFLSDLWFASRIRNLTPFNVSVNVVLDDLWKDKKNSPLGRLLALPLLAGGAGFLL